MTQWVWGREQVDDEEIGVQGIGKDRASIAWVSLAWAHTIEQLSWQLGLKPAPTPSALMGGLGTGNFK